MFKKRPLLCLSASLKGIHHEKDLEMCIESQKEKNSRLSRQNGDKRGQTRIKQEESEGKEAVDRIAGRE